MLLWILNLDFAASGSDAPTPQPPDEPYPRPAGRSRRRRRYEVEIDGQIFEVETPAHAVALLERAAEVARTHAKAIVAPVVAKRIATNRPVPTPVPLISSDEPELKTVIAEHRRRITDIYRKVAMEEEIRLRMQRKIKEEDDDDDDILLLL